MFYDTTTHQTRQAHHVDFNETYFHESKAPPYAQKIKTIAETAIANKEIDDMLMKNTIQSDVTKPSTTPQVQSTSKYVSHVKENNDASTDGDKVNSVHSSNNNNVQYEDLILLDLSYDKMMKLKIGNRGIHPTRGLELVKEKERSLLKGCVKSTLVAWIPCWRGTLRDAIVCLIDGVKVESATDVEKLIQQNNAKYIFIGFILRLKLPSHPTENIPVIHFDQFMTIAHQHMAAKHDTEPWMNAMEPPDITPDLIYIAQQKGLANSKLTQENLKKQDDWPLWKISEYQQLNQYNFQDMFQDPVPQPPDANVLQLISIYVYKTNGVCKARLVCNGSPQMKGTITLDHTYAAALEQTEYRLF